MVADTQPGNLQQKKDAITHTWNKVDYFVNLANSVPRRIKAVIQEKGNMTKY